MWECTLCWPPLLNVKTIFLPLFLKESINQILASNKDFMGFFFVCDVFISIWKIYHAGGAAKRKIKLVWPIHDLHDCTLKFDDFLLLFFLPRILLKQLIKWSKQQSGPWEIVIKNWEVYLNPVRYLGFFS